MVQGVLQDLPPFSRAADLPAAPEGGRGLQVLSTHHTAPYIMEHPEIFMSTIAQFWFSAQSPAMENH